AGLCLFPNEKIKVPTIRLPNHVGEVSDNRNRPDCGFQEYIGDHAGERDSSRTAPPCGEDNEERGQTCKRISKSWNPPNDCVQPKTDAGSRKAEHVVKHRGDVVQMFV